MLGRASGGQAFVPQSPSPCFSFPTSHIPLFTIELPSSPVPAFPSAKSRLLNPDSCFFHNPTYYTSLLSAARQETECPRSAGAATAMPAAAVLMRQGKERWAASKLGFFRLPEGEG
jgi:hypothetical protein